MPARTLSSEETMIERVGRRPSVAHSTGSRLLQNTVSNVAGQIFIAVLTLFSTPYITRKLGATQYGALSLLMTYLFAFSLLNLGINASLVKYMAELMPKGRMEEVQKYFSTSLTVLVGIGILIGVFVCTLAPVIVQIWLQGAEGAHGIRRSCPTHRERCIYFTISHSGPVRGTRCCTEV